MTFLYQFPSYSHLIIPIRTHSHSNTAFQFSFFPIASIPIPTCSRSHFQTTLKPRNVYYVVNSKQNMKLQQKHCNQTHHSSVTIIIIITITANHFLLFTVQRLSDCHWEFYFSPIKYAIPIPIGIPWEWEFRFPYTPLQRMRQLGFINQAFACSPSSLTNTRKRRHDIRRSAPAQIGLLRQ